MNKAINKQALFKYELKQIDNKICFYEDKNCKN